MSIQPVGSFHVRHDLTPPVARDAMLLLRQEPASDGNTLLQRARERDYALGRLASPDKVLASLRDLGLVERGGKGGPIRLSPRGVGVASAAARDSLLFTELVHLRYWSLWSDATGGAAFAWAYRVVCTTLWEAAPMRIEPDQLTATILASAEERFGLRSVSFSRSSVLGVMHWLRALRPACVKGDNFSRRPACAPETFLLALRAAGGLSSPTTRIPLRLEASLREQVCRSLLLDLGAFDEMIERAEEGYGVVRLQSTGAERLILPAEDPLTSIALQPIP